MTLIGVTGTNGKTTTTYLLKTILEQTLGAKVGLIGTNQNLVGHEVLPARRTTPDAYDPASPPGQDGGGRVQPCGDGGLLPRPGPGADGGVALPHGYLHEPDARTIWISTGTWTAYRQAKSLLFRQCDSGCFNLDDNSGRLLIRGADCRVVTFGVNQRRGGSTGQRDQAGSRTGCDFLVDTPQETLPGDGADPRPVHRLQRPGGAGLLAMTWASPWRRPSRPWKRSRR